jgi:hypothetical protein
MEPTIATSIRRTTTRRRSGALRTALLAMSLLLGATAAHAADACFRDGIGDVSVFKGYKTPRPGDCKPLTGFTLNSTATLNGTVCGSSDGSTLYLNFTYMISANQFGTASFAIARSNGNGNGKGCDGRTDGNAWGCSTFGVEKIACPRPAIFAF